MKSVVKKVWHTDRQMGGRRTKAFTAKTENSFGNSWYWHYGINYKTYLLAGLVSQRYIDNFWNSIRRYQACNLSVCTEPLYRIPSIVTRSQQNDIRVNKYRMKRSCIYFISTTGDKLFQLRLQRYVCNKSVSVLSVKFKCCSRLRYFDHALSSLNQGRVYSALVMCQSFFNFPSWRIPGHLCPNKLMPLCDALGDRLGHVSIEMTKKCCLGYTSVQPDMTMNAAHIN